MAGWFTSIFGKGPEGLMDDAERLAAEERWPEAIDLLEQARAKAADGPPGLGEKIDERIGRCTSAYLDLLEEAIPRFVADGNHEKAAELVEIALTFATDEERKKAIGALLDLPARAAPREAASRAAEKYSDELIDSLLHGYLESVEPSEREEIRRRSFSFQRAFVLWHQGEAEGARRAAEEHLVRESDDAYGHLYLGLSLAALDRTEEAVRAFENAVAQDPSLVPATLGLAAMERRRKRWGRSIELLEKLVSIVRAYPDRFGIGRRDEVFETALQVLLEAGEWKRAEALYGELHKADLTPRRPAFEARLAEVKGDLAGAASCWEGLLRARPAEGTITGHGSREAGTGPAEHEEAGDFFARIGKGRKALDLYRKAALLLTRRIHYAGEMREIPYLIGLKKKMALLLIAEGERREAEAIAGELEQLDPAPPEAREIREALDR